MRIANDCKWEQWQATSQRHRQVCAVASSPGAVQAPCGSAFCSGRHQRERRPAEPGMQPPKRACVCAPPSMWCPGALFNLNAAPANCHATFHAQCDWLLPRGLFTSLAPISRDCVAPGSAGAESAGTPGECSAMPFPPSLGSSTAAGAGWPNRSKSEARSAQGPGVLHLHARGAPP